MGLGRGEGQGLRGGCSALAVHGRRGCPPPRLAPGPEGRASEQAGGGRSGARRGGGGGGGRSSLGGGRTEPDSGRRRRRLGACGSLPRDPVPRRQTDPPQGPRPPHPPPGPPSQLPHSLSLSPDSSFPCCSQRGKKIFFLSCRTKGGWKERGKGGEKKEKNSTSPMRMRGVAGL